MSLISSSFADTDFNLEVMFSYSALSCFGTVKSLHNKGVETNSIIDEHLPDKLIISSLNNFKRKN